MTSAEGPVDITEARVSESLVVLFQSTGSKSKTSN